MGTFFKAEYKTIGGVRHKLCRGVCHPEGAFVAEGDYYVNKSGRQAGTLYHLCKECVRARQGSEPNVVITQAWQNFVTELVNRLGAAETARRVGRSDTWVRSFRKRKTYMRRETARRILAALRDVRASGEVRHRDSIHIGAHLRGWTEKTPTARSHFYKTNGDKETEARRKFRQRTGR